MPAIARLSPWLVSVSMLCGTAYAGDIALTCSGTRSTVGVGKSPASMSLVIHQETRKVTSSTKHFGVSIITAEADGTIKFKGKTWKGTIDRSGHAYVYSRPAHTIYDLSCRSAKDLF